MEQAALQPWQEARETIVDECGCWLLLKGLMPLPSSWPSTPPPRSKATWLGH